MNQHLEASEHRKAKFLDVLAATGSVAAACRATATDNHGPRAGKSTWNDLRRRDPEFALAWDNAIADALAAVEETIMDRAMNPATTPITNRQGEVVGFREDRLSSDRLLLRIASRLDPEAWAERKRQDHHVEGQINHTAQLALAPNDILLLDEADQKELIRLIETIEARKDPLRIEAGNE